MEESEKFQTYFATRCSDSGHYLQLQDAVEKISADWNNIPVPLLEAI